MGKTAGGGRYIKGVQLGKGQFGAVYKAYDTQLQQWVAVKKIHLGDKEEGVNVTALREIKLLKEIQHEHVVRLIDVFQHKRNVNLVFEFMDTDLEAVIRDRNIVLSPGDIKAYMQMTLKALAYVHSKWVLHRDMKPNNLLISATGVLKLADFGLARIFGSPDRRFTNQVFARWYRAPELLFGARNYGSAVDMWGVGCVFAELLLRRPFLQGTSDLDQLGKVFAAFGTPQESQWPDVKCLPDYVEFYPSPPQPLRALFPTASEDALDLLGRMFALDPNTRITAQQALEHRYFVLGPPPTKAKDLPRPPPPRAEDPIPVPVPVAEPGVKKDSKAAAGQKAPAAAHQQAAAAPSPGTKAARLSYGRAEDGVGRGGKRGDVHSSGHWTEGEHQNLKGGVDGSTLVAMRAIGQADASSARLGAAEDGLTAAGRVSDAHMATGRDSDVSMSGRASDVHMAGGVGETPKDPAARVPLGSAAAPMSVESGGMGGTGQRGSGGHQQQHHQQQHQNQQQQQVQLHQLHPALAPVVLPPRPTISSSERNSLKRKLDLDGT